VSPIDPVNTHQVKEFEHPAPLLTCQYDSTGRFVFAGARDNHLQRVDVATGGKILMEGHESWVCTMAKGPGLLFSGDYTGTVIAWSVSEKEVVKKWSIEAHPQVVRSISVSPDGKQLATAGRDGKVRLWSADTGERLREFSGHSGQVYATTFHPDGMYLVSAEREGNKLFQWDLTTGKKVREFDAGDMSAYRRYEDIEWGGARGLAFDAAGTILACCGRHNYAGPATVLLYDWKSGKQTEKLVSEFKGIFYTLQFHSQGFMIAAAGDITVGELWFWKPGQEKALANIKTSGPALGLDFHPDGHHLAIAQSQGGNSKPENGSLIFYDMRPDGKTEKEAKAKIEK
jgi:WD40 repeat protein